MTTDEQEIRNLVTTWMAATKAGDLDTVLSLMADDVVFLAPGQPVMRKVGFAAAAKPRYRISGSLESRFCRQTGVH